MQGPLWPHPSQSASGHLPALHQMYLEHYWADVPDHDSNANRKHQEIFRRCLDCGNKDLITQYQHETYIQNRGLAMGVADSPDLANLYGYHFEKLSGIQTDPKIPFYGRYIDDCLAIVYASSEHEALQYLSNKIHFDECVIEWNVSFWSQPFLDMSLYKDQFGKLQYMPYRKLGNHMERIPWISFHPFDVKKGTFIGEMSRLATLSSTSQHYLDAMRGLVALYVQRGYPVKLVQAWLKDNLSERWKQRLTSKDEAGDKPQVLVLKTEFNPAWNYFHASQFGEEMMGYWREWLKRADCWDFNKEFPAPTESTDLEVKPEFLLGSAFEREMRVPDVRKIDILDRRVITSRKRTRNLLDLTSLWKKTVLEKLDANIGLEQDPNPILIAPVYELNRQDPPPGERDITPESDDGLPHRRASPVPNPWRAALW
jgi:hypothetical protein